MFRQVFSDPPSGPVVVLESSQAPARLMGWEGPLAERVAFEACLEAGFAHEWEDVAEQCNRIIQYRLRRIGATGPRPKTWDLEVEAVASGKLGGKFPIHLQDTGNCVAAAIEMLGQQRSIIETVLFKQEERIRPWFTPYIYAVSRNQIGGGMSGAGSTGAWGARAVNEYGVLFADDEGVPSYAGTSDDWGNRRNVNNPEYEKFFAVAADNKISIVRMNNVEKIAEAIEAGIMFAVASMQGFDVREYKGFHCFRPSGSWAHQMHWTDVLRDPFPALYRGNQWGPNAHGKPLNGERPGGAWNLFEDVEKEIRSSSVEVYGFFDFAGDPGPIEPGIL
jgi:hypothetical protein